MNTQDMNRGARTLPVLRRSRRRLNLEVCIPLVLVLAAACGCASTGEPPVRFSDISEQLPPIPAGHGRLYIYGVARTAYRPIKVHVDGVRFPDIYRGGFYFIDLAAGNHEVTSALFDDIRSAFGKSSLEIDVTEGETLFVEPIVRNSIPVSSRLLLVQSDSPETTLARSSYIGSMPPHSATPR